LVLAFFNLSGGGLHHTGGHLANDEFGVGYEEDGLAESLEARLEAVIVEVYPVLCQRLRMSRFAGWHRDHDRLDDLAQQATCQLLSHCRKNRKLPKAPLNYLVTIAKNLAKREYQESLTDPAEVAEQVLDLSNEDETREGDPVKHSGAKIDEQRELLRAAIERLPRRQCEAFNLQMKEPGATDKELGVRMGIGEDAFRKNSTRAYERLKHALKRK
jgi:RNA polymerase sigma factor (sigma-70 family)